MGRGKANTLAQEVHDLVKTYPYHQWHVVEAILQIIDREKIMVINRYRKNHDEPELIPEPQRYKGINQEHTKWIVDVPKDWYSLTGKGGQ